MANWQNRIIGHEWVDPDQLLANPLNFRIHPKFQQDALEGILDTIGWIDEIKVNQRTQFVLDGHLRVALAITRGEQVPVKYVDLSEDEERLALAEFDYISAQAGTDVKKLDALLKSVNSDNAAIQAMLAKQAADAGLYGDSTPADAPEAQIDRADELQQIWQCQRGQLWIIPSKAGKGEHRLLCGDSTNADDVARVMDGEKAQGVFTSPPYAEQRKHQYGGIPADEYVEWWDDIQANVRNHICDDGSFFVNIKPHCSDGERSLYVMDLVTTMRRKWDWKFVDEFSWLHEDLPGAWANRLRNGFEPVYQFSLQAQIKFYPKNVAHPSASVRNGRGGLQKTDGGNWTLDAPLVEGMAQPSNVLKIGGNTVSVNHSAVFPVALPDFFIRAYSDTGDIWLDPFVGSGTVIVAAEQNKRIGYGVELLPNHCAVILQRLSDMGLQPELQHS